MFLYKQVLDTHLGQLEDFVRAKRSHNLPVVLSRAEVDCLLAKMDGIHKLLAALLYGTGMRLLEAVRLRVQDIDFANHRIHVHQAKGKKDRYVPLNDDLYPCPQPARRGCIQPTGPTAHGEVSVR